MKQFFSLVAAAMISFGAFAQLPDGSMAPDFTATDINGVEHNLYSYLDSGYQVILDFSATWCGPCWSYHTSGVFSELNATYGPAAPTKSASSSWSLTTPPPRTTSTVQERPRKATG